MELVQQVAKAVAPVILLALIGFAWKRGGWSYDSAFVTRLAMTVSIPCLAFGLPDLALGVLVLQVASPVAVTSYMLRRSTRRVPTRSPGSSSSRPLSPFRRSFFF